MIVVWEEIGVIGVNGVNVVIVTVVGQQEMVGSETEMAVVLIVMAISATVTDKVDAEGDTKRRKSIDLI